jgi:vacuolar-type H+-ATPase subunit H
MLTPKLLFRLHIFMTILDKVLQSETTSAKNIAEAKAAAVQQVADAHTTQVAVVDAAKAALAETTATELAVHEQNVQKNSESITAKAHKDVAAIKTAFSAKAADFATKISEAVA